MKASSVRDADFTRESAPRFHADRILLLIQQTDQRGEPAARVRALRGARGLSGKSVARERKMNED
jgi:hypothetical protein